MGLIQGNKMHSARVPVTALACTLGGFCETAPMSWSPCERMVRSEPVFSPFSAEPGRAGCSIPLPGGGDAAAAETPGGHGSQVLFLQCQNIPGCSIHGSLLADKF